MERLSKDKNLEIVGKKFEYNKDLKILNVITGEVLIKSNNIKIIFETMFVDEKKLIMSAKGNVIIYDLNNNLVFKTEIINFDRVNNILSSPTESVFEDDFNNYFKASRFEYKINENTIKAQNIYMKDSDENIFEIENSSYKYFKSIS